MSDECDRAFDLEDHARSVKVRLASEAAQVRPALSEVCLECGELTVAGARWCNVDCRDSWQLRQR